MPLETCDPAMALGTHLCENSGVTWRCHGADNDLCPTTLATQLALSCGLCLLQLSSHATLAPLSRYSWNQSAVTARPGSRPLSDLDASTNGTASWLFPCVLPCPPSWMPRPLSHSASASLSEPWSSGACPATGMTVTALWDRDLGKHEGGGMCHQAAEHTRCARSRQCPSQMPAACQACFKS